MPKLTIDQPRRLVIVGKKEVHLTFREFNLLSLLVENEGRVVSRESMITGSWGEAARTIDQHIARIRRKVGRKRIRTVSKVGYAFNLGA